MTNPQIKYTSKDFESLRLDLIEYSKLYFKDSYGDFGPLSTGTMMMELMSYIGDVLSYNQDAQYKEIFDPSELKNAIRLLKLVGGKYRGKTQANLVATMYAIIPSVILDGNVQPDPDYLPIINKGMIAATSNNKKFISTEVCDFRDETNTEMTPYSYDGDNIPTSFAIKKPVNMVSGTVLSYQVSIGDPQPFLKIELPEFKNVLEIITVVDSYGDEWYEVEYLAQDEILINEPNTNPATNAQIPYILRRMPVAKRFTTETDYRNITSLQFGSSARSISSSAIFTNPAKYQMHNVSNNAGFFSFNNNIFLESGTLGATPSNLDLTIYYLEGGGLDYNINSKELNSIVSKTVSLALPISELDSVKAGQVLSSLTITNYSQATDGINGYTVDDIKQLVPIFYASQKRAVTLEDYVSIMYNFPAKYGGIYRATALNDTLDISAIALYILTMDYDGNLQYASNLLKNNLKTYLSKYRMITDSVNIYDGKIINFTVSFDVVANFGENVYEVQERIIEELWNYFINIHFNFADPIYLSNIVRLVDDVQGVLSVNDIFIDQPPYGYDGYSTSIFNFQANENTNIITPGLDEVFELKYRSDITGVVTSQK